MDIKSILFVFKLFFRLSKNSICQKNKQIAAISKAEHNNYHVNKDDNLRKSTLLNYKKPQTGCLYGLQLKIEIFKTMVRKMCVEKQCELLIQNLFSEARILNFVRVL